MAAGHLQLPVHAGLQLAYAPLIELGAAQLMRMAEREKVSEINGKARQSAWFS